MPSHSEGERKIGGSVFLDPLERATLNDRIIFLACTLNVENFSHIPQKPQSTHHHPSFFKTNFNSIFPSALYLQN